MGAAVMILLLFLCHVDLWKAVELMGAEVGAVLDRPSDNDGYVDDA
jgi:hypothetical protein